jgi:alanyl aminopeptidase
MKRLLTFFCSAVLAGCATTHEPSQNAASAARPMANDVHAARAADAPAPSPPRLRLPEGARPVRNMATLTVVPTRDTFDGDMRIDLDVSAPLSTLWLNADGLTVDRAEVESGGATIGARVVPGGSDFVGLLFDRPLAAGRARVHLIYRGKLSATEIDGASKQNEGGDWYVYTHFEPIAARRVFPCFDEPSFKVPWQITLRVKKGDIALSNTPIESTDEGKDGFTAVRFEETPPLPSYLVAFAVGPFGVVDAGKPGLAHTPVRIITPRGKEAWARFAAESTGPILTLLEKYFGHGYPYSKLDMIAVPVFGGAMENPGLITFRQSIILAKPGAESTGFRRGYAGTATHELAHQWFGDLVTTAWWDDLWLNEAFATWMTPKIIEQYRPDWDAPSGRTSNASGAMRTDSLMSARQIRQPIVTNDDIKNAFDGITYQKGAAVIAMFERWVGADAFQRGVQRYMREHAHSTALAKDFLAAVSTEAGRDIAPAFATFLDQAGVPRVDAELACDAKSAKLTLKQMRYLPVGSEGTTNGAAWQVPVCARFGLHGKTERACTLLASATGELPVSACPDWVFPNDGASGYYRTGYSADLLLRLKKHLDALSAVEKIALLGNLNALAQANQLDYGALLPLVPALARDKNVHVVDTAARTVASLRDSRLIDEATRPAYARFVQGAFGARARALGLHSKPGEDEETRWLRPTILEVVADVGEDPQLRAECTKLARAWLADKNAIEPELVGTVLTIAAAVGDRALFDAFLADAKKTPERIDRERLVGALGQFRDPSIVPSALALTLADDLDPRDTFRVLFSAARRPETARLAYDFVTTSFDRVVSRLPRDWGASLPNVGAALCDDARKTEVQSFFQDRSSKFVGGPRVLTQAMESMHLCSALREAQEPKVRAFFARP